VHCPRPRGPLLNQVLNGKISVLRLNRLQTNLLPTTQNKFYQSKKNTPMLFFKKKHTNKQTNGEKREQHEGDKQLWKHTQCYNVCAAAVICSCEPHGTQKCGICMSCLNGALWQALQALRHNLRLRWSKNLCNSTNNDHGWSGRSCRRSGSMHYICAFFRVLRGECTIMCRIGYDWSEQHDQI
jgi:hypothetical protein